MDEASEAEFLINCDGGSLRADFGYWGGEERKKLQSLRNGVSFLV